MPLIDEIQETQGTLISTGFPWIDAIFSTSYQYDNNGDVVATNVGLPTGKLLLLGGEEGVGKTKFYSTLAVYMLRLNRKILIFQMEMSVSEYKSFFKQIHRSLGYGDIIRNSCNLRIEDSIQPERQAQIIDEFKPDIVIFDSFPQIYGNNSKRGIDDIVLNKLKPALLRNNTCGIIVSHLNQQGKIKGNNHISYMVDGVFFIEWDRSSPDNKAFCLLKSGKNRGGISGQQVKLKHYKNAMIFLK